MFDIVKDYNNILVNCSGGADSSIMLFELIRTLEENNIKDKNVHVLTLGHARKDNWNPQVAQGVIRFIVGYFKTSLIRKHHIYYYDLPEPEYFTEAQLEIYKLHNIDLQMNATSMAPRKDATIELNGKTIDIVETCPVKKRQDGFEIFSEMVHDSKKIPPQYRPWGQMTKDQLAEIYKKHSLVDTLLPLTRSCEGLANVTNNYSTVCGDCWWCHERYWAFGKF